MSMDPRHKALLRSQRLFLVEEILVDETITQYLYQEGVLTFNHLEEIHSETTSQRKTLKLLDILPKCGSDAFYQFIQALKYDFPWIGDKLQSAAEDETPPPLFSAQCGVPDHILPTVPTTRNLNLLAARLSSEWKSVLMDLGLSPADVHCCCAEQPLSVQNQVLAGLVMWKQRNGREATVRRLLQSLEVVEITPSVLQQVFL